ncbi:MAG: class I SAM-dependent methyltransferase [Lachnospiraceae bacterium]|nr:class I SAM-dependent methyltransferase [Lachnospiraceae bacterium]
MEAYTQFARVYDMFMDNVPYEEWRDYLLEILHREGIRDGLVLDLGCGTGVMTRLLAQAGYDMIGVDASEEMLMAAREESMEYPGILYLLQDMREFELYGTVRAIVSVCDSVNYVLTEDDLRSVFALANNYLDPGGVFIFDMNTLYKYRELLGERTFCENREEGSFIWENYFDEETGINQYDLTLFIREEDGRYGKYEETHVQRAYDMDTVQRLIEEAGMKYEGAFRVPDGGAPEIDTERIYIVAREQGK